MKDLGSIGKLCGARKFAFCLCSVVGFWPNVLQFFFVLQDFLFLIFQDCLEVMRYVKTFLETHLRSHAIV